MNTTPLSNSFNILNELEKEDDVNVPNEPNTMEANVASSSKSGQRAPSEKLHRRTGIWSSKPDLSPWGFVFGELGDSDEDEVFEPNDDMSRYMSPFGGGQQLQADDFDFSDGYEAQVYD